MKYIYVTYQCWKNNIHSYGDFATECKLISIKDLKKYAAKRAGGDIEYEEILIHFTEISKEEFNIYRNDYQ